MLSCTLFSPPASFCWLSSMSALTHSSSFFLYRNKRSVLYYIKPSNGYSSPSSMFYPLSRSELLAVEYPDRFLHLEVLDLPCLSDADLGNNYWHPLMHSLLLLSPSHLKRLTSSLLVSLGCISYGLSTPLALALVFLSSPLRTSSLRSLRLYSHKRRHMPLLLMALS